MCYKFTYLKVYFKPLYRDVWTSRQRVYPLSGLHSLCGIPVWVTQFHPPLHPCTVSNFATNHRPLGAKPGSRTPGRGLLGGHLAHIVPVSPGGASRRLPPLVLGTSGPYRRVPGGADGRSAGQDCA